MGYLVRFSARAERDLDSLFEEIHAGHSGAALKWYVGLKKAILSLEETPNRCPHAQESKKLRNLLYGKKPHIYRVIYRIVEMEKRVDFSISGMGRGAQPD